MALALCFVGTGMTQPRKKAARTLPGPCVAFALFALVLRVLDAVLHVLGGV